MSEAQEKIQYFRTILLKVNQVFSWVYGEDFSLIESNCTWEMVLKNFFLLTAGSGFWRFRKKRGLCLFISPTGFLLPGSWFPLRKISSCWGPPFPRMYRNNISANRWRSVK